MNCLRIELADNGFVLSYTDPSLQEANRRSDNWVDPERRRVYETSEALVADLAPLMAKMSPKPTTPDDVYADAIREEFAKQD